MRGGLVEGLCTGTLLEIVWAGLGKVVIGTGIIVVGVGRGLVICAMMSGKGRWWLDKWGLGGLNVKWVLMMAVLGWAIDRLTAVVVNSSRGIVHSPRSGMDCLLLMVVIEWN